ncbi:short-chain dehydrogenases/reductase [Aspergillus flavus]|nr:short-chain dehydrogenases/reductase [Aspergillus flavus]
MASPRSGFAVVTPASRGIGFALARYLLQHTDLPIIATARRNSDNLRHRLLCGMENSAAEQRLSVFDVDVTEEPTVRSLADDIRQTHPKAPLRLALTVPGILHVEKSPSQIDAHAALESLKVNTIGPMLLMKHLTPFLPTRSSPLFDPFDGEVKLPQHAIYAMMAARVGSISDNRMGGWYSYRASKAAVFQLAKTLDLYLEGKCADRAISLAMHPGTVKTDFTKSYQDGREMLSAEESAERLCGVLDMIKSYYASVCQLCVVLGEGLPRWTAIFSSGAHFVFYLQTLLHIPRHIHHDGIFRSMQVQVLPVSPQALHNEVGHHKDAFRILRPRSYVFGVGA